MLRASEFSPGLYRGGFLVFAVAAAVAVTAVSRPGGFLAWVFGSKPGRWMGTRSYALYLWHWPVFVYTRPQLDVPLTGTANLVLRLAVTVILAEGSYRLVEQPLRNLRWRDSWLTTWLFVRTSPSGASTKPLPPPRPASIFTTAGLAASTVRTTASEYASRSAVSSVTILRS